MFTVSNSKIKKECVFFTTEVRSVEVTSQVLSDLPELCAQVTMEAEPFVM